MTDNVNLRSTAKIKHVYAGDVFGSWTVVSGERIESVKALFRCACGEEKVLVVAVVRNRKGSCGCKRRSVHDGEKLCRGCDRRLPVEKFCFIQTRKVYAHRCKDCAYTAQSEWRKTDHGSELMKGIAARQRSTDHCKEYQSAYRKRESFASRRKKHSKDYRDSHKEEITAKAREKRKETFARDKVARSFFLKTDKGKAMVMRYMHKRRSNKENMVSDLTAGQWSDIKEYFGFCCAYCGIFLDNPTMDHVTPISKGGNHTADNVVPACRSCNCSKGAKTLTEWVRVKSVSARHLRRKCVGPCETHRMRGMRS